MNMERIVFLNRDFVAESNAKLSIFDRGLLFADAVYEGFGVIDSQIVDFEYHINRLTRSCDELAMASPMDKDELFVMLMRLIAENELVEGFLYLHVTRGEGDRSFFYNDSYKPNIFAFTQGAKFVADDPAPAVKVLTTPDLRWVRRDIKSTNFSGKIQFVTSFPDIKIKFVESFPDIKVKFVKSFPDKCGQWNVVESFPDFRVKMVKEFPDIKVKVVESFPGTN